MAVAEVNSQRDENGMSYARKAMIKGGLSKDALGGEWKETQLFEHLKVIVHKHRGRQITTTLAFDYFPILVPR